jgi:hypothetical protein
MWNFKFRVQNDTSEFGPKGDTDAVACVPMLNLFKSSSRLSLSAFRQNWSAD